MCHDGSFYDEPWTYHFDRYKQDNFGRGASARLQDIKTRRSHGDIRSPSSEWPGYGHTSSVIGFGANPTKTKPTLLDHRRSSWSEIINNKVVSSDSFVDLDCL